MGRAELKAAVAELVDTLQQSRRAVRAELERIGPSPDHNDIALLQLGEAVRNFSDQSEVLLRILTERDPTSTLIEAAEDLLAFFLEAERQIEAVLGVGRA